MEKVMYPMKLKKHLNRVENRANLATQAFSIVYGQCSPAVRDRLEANPKWNAVLASLDVVIELLKMIQTSLFSGATTRHTMHSLITAHDAFMSFRQTSRMTNSAYLDKFKLLLDVFVHLGGEIGVPSTPASEYLVAVDASAPTPTELEAAKKRAQEAYLGVRFLHHSDLNRYGALLAEIENSYTRGQQSYPTTLVQAYNILVNYVNPARNNGTGESQGMAFAQEAGEHEPGRGGGRGGRGPGGGRG